MPWWGWLLEILGVGMLVASAVFSVWNTLGNKPLSPLALLVSAVGSTLVAVVFTLLSPARPPVWLIILSILVGLAVGAGFSFLARFEVQGKLLVSSHGQLHIAIWSLLLLISSILVVAGSGAAEASVAIMLFASLGLAGYAGALYSRYRAEAGKDLQQGCSPQPGTSLR